MDNLEGGLSYLQDVVINDALGINDELESQMNAVVDAYQCEWKTTLENEEARKRFRQFVNSNESDSNIQFVSERGQVRPATEKEKLAGAEKLIPVAMV
jgi:nitrite reductase (NADH) large subunit